jgi:hypothetical protein
MDDPQIPNTDHHSRLPTSEALKVVGGGGGSKSGYQVPGLQALHVWTKGNSKIRLGTILDSESRSQDPFDFHFLRTWNLKFKHVKSLFQNQTRN